MNLRDVSKRISSWSARHTKVNVKVLWNVDMEF